MLILQLKRALCWNGWLKSEVCNRELPSFTSKTSDNSRIVLIFQTKMAALGHDPIAIVSTQVTLECLSSAVLFCGSYLIYKGIEIGHPVYAVILANLIGTLASSLLNSALFPFLTPYRYTSLANLNNIVCLAFHCCCWCILRFFVTCTL